MFGDYTARLRMTKNVAANLNIYEILFVYKYECENTNAYK